MYIIYVPIEVKFGMEKYILGPLLHARFGPDW